MLHSNQPDIKSLEIREVQAGDIPILDRLFPKKVPNKHAERLARQLSRDAVYLIATLHSKPVGHIMLFWEGLDIPQVKEKFKSIPVVEALHVDRAYKGRGIEEALLEECYKRLKEKGHQTLGLSLGMNSIEEKMFYHRNGFLDSGISEYYVEWPVLDDATGEQKIEGEMCRFFVKHM